MELLVNCGFVQAQPALSSLLYHLSEKGFGTEKLSTLSGIDQNKLHFILTGKENKDSSLNYGFNFSDLVYIKNVTGLDYSYLFSGK